MKEAVITPWHNAKQRDEFLEAWGLQRVPDYLYLQEDVNKEGCARTKNAGIQRALADGAELICVLDDDCYPPDPEYRLPQLIEAHRKALEPQDVTMVSSTTHPAPARGTPYFQRSIKMPVAASMGFWLLNADLDAPTSMVLGADTQVAFARHTIFGKYFPFSGMNFAFHREWAECAVLIDAPRFDDIWMGWIWQKLAYEKGCCFNLNGPLVNHVRQSNVWKNLQDEVKYLELNETIWQAIHRAPRDMAAKRLREEFFQFSNPKTESHQDDPENIN